MKRAGSGLGSANQVYGSKDPVRIHTKMSRIRNTARKTSGTWSTFLTPLLVTLYLCMSYRFFTCTTTEDANCVLCLNWPREMIFFSAALSLQSTYVRPPNIASNKLTNNGSFIQATKPVSSIRSFAKDLYLEMTARCSNIANADGNRSRFFL